MRQGLANLAKGRWFLPSFSMQVSDSITITTGADIQIIYQPMPFADASCPTTGYTTSPVGISLSEPAGGSTFAYLCINNIGTGSDTPTISITGVHSASCGLDGTSPCFSVSPATLPTIPSHGFSSPITLTISNFYTTAQSSPIALTLTIT